MLNANRVMLVFSIMIVLIIGVGAVSASEDIDSNLTLSDDVSNDFIGNADNESYSSSNLQAQENYVINQRNYKMYFDDEGVLKSDYGGQILTFDGEFKDRGVLTINSDNTKITGRNALFNNTVFNIKADGVMLTNLRFVANERFTNNNNAIIYVTGDNVTICDNEIDYDVPYDVDAYGIYSTNNQDINIINNTISYVGHAYHSGHNYDILLYYSDNAYVCGNQINSTLPLREIDYGKGFFGDYVSSFAAGYSMNLQLTSNNIFSDINFGEYLNGIKYPTLSSVLIYGCGNSTINKNNINVKDLYTRKNVANYLYALDIYRLDDLTIVENSIDVFTYGGYGRDGTAYPIQVTGPSNNLKIAYNYLHSVSNGPNIGIYSQNYYGATQIDIISNFINITGKASTDIWALVAGIEVQDSNDKILNNTIIVNTVGGYKSGDRIYGISYSQSTGGEHEYDIKYNHVTVPGPIAISLNQGMNTITKDTNVMYNILVTGVGEGGDRAVSIGGSGANNIIRYNTNGKDTIRHMSDRDLPEWLKNYNSGGNGNSNGLDFSWLNNNGARGNGLSTEKGSGYGLNVNGKVNGNNVRYSESEALKGDSNSTRYTYGLSGVSIASSSSSAGSASSQSAKSESKSYEITKQIEEIKDINYLQTLIAIILVLILLAVGYEKKHKEEENL